MKTRLSTAILATLLVASCSRGPSSEPPPIASPEVQSDGSAIFRVWAPNAKEVMLALEGADAAPMTRDSQGIWSIQTKPLEPNFYGYRFLIDGVMFSDPNNVLIKPDLLRVPSMLHVPGQGLPWEIADVPHGEIHHHFYKSALIGDQRDYFVYTPPGYDPAAKTTYPVLYLLHGYTEDARAWTVTGRANVILDNLIAQGTAKPMLIVMPLAYGAPEILTRDGRGIEDLVLRQKNYDRFRDELLSEVIPQIEKSYRVIKDPSARAIAGDSMGATEALYIGLNALDRFAWIASFSTGTPGDASTFPALDSKANSQIRLLWIGCGRQDEILESNRKFREWLASKGVTHTDFDSPGGHTFMVWRRYLAVFASQLFR